jgi:uncharacterized protein
MKNFKTLYGLSISNIIEYIKEYILIRDNIEILIGCDSQTYGKKKTVYGVVLALYTPGKGAHVLCYKETTPVEYSKSQTLLNEVWKSIELAEFLRTNGLPKAKYIDIDLNPDPKYKSNEVLRQAMGMIEGMGYNPRCKHNGVMMTYAADYLIRK